MSLSPAHVKRKLRLTTTAFFFLSGIVTATWASRIPEIQQKFHLSDAEWGGVLFALPAGLVTGLTLSSYMIARFSSRRMMVIGGVIFSLLLSLLGLVDHVTLLVILLFCFGFSRNLFTMSINTNAIEVQRLYTKPIIASFHGLWSLACLLAAGLGTLMITRNVRPRFHFIVVSISVSILILLIKHKGGSKKKSLIEKKPFFIKPDQYLLILGLICFCCMICEGTMFDWAVNYFAQVIKPAKNQTTFGYASFITTMTMGRLIGDKVIAYLGREKVILMNGMLMASGFIVAVSFPYLWPACAGFFLIGLGDSIIIPTVYSLAGVSQVMKPAYAIASVTMIGYAGFLSGPLLVGNLSQRFGMSSAFAVLAVVSFIISFLAMLLLKWKNGKP